MDGTNDLTNAKLQNDFIQAIRSTKKIMTKDSSNIPSMDELNDENKGTWVEHEDEHFNKLFNGLLDYCADEECYDNLDWDSVNYDVYGADYYQENFPGFPDEVYEILAKSTKEENKVIDNRIPPLKITEGEFIVKFD